MAGAAAEAAIIAASTALYLLYHAYFFLASGFLHVRDGGRNLFSKGRVARVQFCELICGDDDTIAGIQQNRNCLLGVSFLAGTSSILAQKVLSIILDTAQLEQIREYGVRLPLCYGCVNRSYPPLRAGRTAVHAYVRRSARPQRLRVTHVYCRCLHRSCLC